MVCGVISLCGIIWCSFVQVIYGVAFLCVLCYDVVYHMWHGMLCSLQCVVL